LKAIAEQHPESDPPQKALSKKLKRSQSLTTRLLSGEERLSLRTIAELAWALDREIVFEFRAPTAAAGQNISPETSTVRHSQIKFVSLRNCPDQANAGVAIGSASSQPVDDD
jgi:hypothetical protein